VIAAVDDDIGVAALRRRAADSTIGVAALRRSRKERP
jgi:hypothetical protein